MRREIQQPQRRVGLHDLALLRASSAENSRASAGGPYRHRLADAFSSAYTRSHLRIAARELPHAARRPARDKTRSNMRRGTSWKDRRYRASLSFRPALRPRARRTWSPAADTKPKRRYRRVRSRAPSGWSARYLPKSRPDIQTAERSTRECRGGADFRELRKSARRACLCPSRPESSAIPIRRPSTLRRIRRVSVRATVSRVIRSQRDCILNGNCAPVCSTASANARVHCGDSAKISSANQRCSAPQLAS